MAIIKSECENKTSYSLQGEILLEAQKSEKGDEKIYKISGAIKTMVAPCFAEVIEKCLESCEDFILDFEEVTYIASAGLRVLLNMQQEIDDSESFSVKIINISESVREVLESTGFIDILVIE